MKYFVFGDVHGFFDEWQKALNEAGFDINNPEHILVSLGDITDRGPKSKECLEFIMNKVPVGRRILITGNHEDLMEEAICRKMFLMHDIHNGTRKSAYELTGLDPENVYDDEVCRAMKYNDLWNSYVGSCIDYAEVGDYIFVHGWIPCFDMWGRAFYNRDNWREGDWKKARWINGMEAWNQGIRIEDKTIVCGHWHTSWGHSHLHNVGCEWEQPWISDKIDTSMHSEPFIDKGIIAMDACTAISGRVNIITFDD